ncbi:MAG: 1-acyl-sn-glycerol-3-phosphate acyltransferase [Crocinitomicaceae bacterium]|nr:1-acyl-sn-glycerol-3-phosphate acyltransferase [Crocinitomicaceae bacterium]
MFYNLLKILLGIGTKLYYKEVKVNNVEGLDYDGPKIIIANHPNTLLDAWIIGQVSKEKIYFMTKGTFFNTGLKKWFLSGLGLIPINRATESVTKGVSNADSFEMCYRILEEGKVLVVFPEGNSFIARQLRVLKSGTARIALEVEKRGLASKPIRIIPMGLIYSEANKFRSSVLAVVGESIDPSPFLEEFKENSIKGAKGLTEEFRKSLEGLLVNSTSTEHEALVEDIVQILSSQYVKSDKKGVELVAEQIKETHVKINDMLSSNPQKLDEIAGLVNRIKSQSEQLGIKSDFLDRSYRPRMFGRQLIQSTMLLILGFPLFIYGAIHSFLPYKLTDLVMPKLVKEPEYYAPIAILLGLVLYPLTYSGILLLVNYYFALNGWVMLLYWLSMPLTGLIAFNYYRYTEHISLKTNYMFLMRTEKGTIQSLIENRDRLKTLIFE